mgnify:CR=1 FL=1
MSTPNAANSHNALPTDQELVMKEIGRAHV